MSTTAIIAAVDEIIKMYNADPDHAYDDPADIVGHLEDARSAERAYDRKMEVVVTAMVVSTMTEIWREKTEVAADDHEQISPKAIVEKYLQERCEETLEAHMARRKEWGYGDSFDDNFTTFEMANCTTVTFFDMDNEIIILVARNAVHVDS